MSEPLIKIGKAAPGPDETESGPRCVVAQSDWTESEWFKVWLQLAREGARNNQN